MKSTTKIFIVIIVLIIVILFEVSYIFRKNYTSLFNINRLRGQDNIVVLHSNLTDITGRSYFFETKKDPEGIIPFYKGIGYHDDRNGIKRYYIGSFEKITPIENSSDFYIQLYNPKKTEEKLTAKIKNGLYITDQTHIFVHDLSSEKLQSYMISRNGVPPVDILQKHLQKGDALIIKMELNSDQSNILLDESQSVVSNSIYLRRYDISQLLEQYEK